ncbi:hypothetical protein TMatcc_008537 [Talaromyces marneffei ATCC 18224]|uniref:AB hydrolase-1 domain-containing protein n=1 Tax=Talaromyces marneffei (strain ATCC 18224 / CBS 334.59 / QM 7333) TaxID=441960 RepID=B6QLR2_TALMQ|nr:uncharacterized protein EYB26_007870 [Talaromyces marneffei]EEA22039.1 conserved hypothetical protein [Talaromyces marneffei ATCC 18224]KAE8550501.1 hypothetical protein EYB25_006728 [Talaromyces marneffei]QGA20169.1 hypothetical protein EYB26_007870 [Talaromyces marneffei]
MKPLREFFIPSVHDGTRLSCRIYQLDGINYQELPALKAAIVAHPYASLGGSNDDPVVASITTELVRKGYIVLTLNFRGASYSGGSTSWTGKPEMGDYISAYGFILKYSQLLAPGKHVELVLAGYSYGSMIASHQPNVDDVISIFSKPTGDSLAARILAKAKKLITSAEEETEEEFYGTEEVQLDDDTASDLPPAKISFLLVSPILSYALGFVTLWGNLTKLSVQGHNIVTPALEERLPKFRSLIVYGTDDMFTSEKKLQNWTKKLKDAPESQVDVVEVRMAGHFWVEPSFHQKLRQAISGWLEQK